MRNQVGVGDTLLPAGLPTGIPEIPQDDMSEDKGLGTQHYFWDKRMDSAWGGLPSGPLLRHTEGK